MTDHTRRIQILLDALEGAEAARDAARDRAARLEAVLREAEQAINESVSGLRQCDIPAWSALLATMQTILEETHV